MSYSVAKHRNIESLENICVVDGKRAFLTVKHFHLRHKILQLVAELLNRRGGPLFPFALCICGCFVRILSFRIWGGGPNALTTPPPSRPPLGSSSSSSARFFCSRAKRREWKREETTSSDLRSFGAHMRARDKGSSRHPVTYMRRGGRRGMSSKRKRA